MRLICLTRLVALTALLSATVSAQGRTSAPPTPAAPQAAAQNLTVTVKFTGKGVVDATKNIVVALLDSPTVSPQSRPLAMQSVEKNGGVATFTNVPAGTVYVVAVYDAPGTWDHIAGPPPAGTPLGWYMTPKATAPTAVKVGPKTAVTLTFDGSKKFGQ